MRIKSNARNARKQARLKRLPRFIQAMIADPEIARAILASAPFARMLIPLGIPPEPEYGYTQHDAYVAIFKDALGIIDLSDGEFELAMRIMTPPEFRGREQ
jgi:hypothetical protein